MRHQNVYNRLRRIEGQIRGIEEMVAKDRREEDVLIQLEAVRSAVSGTIGTLVEGMLTSDENGHAVLDEIQVRALLRSFKKSS